jgi:transcriptional regulator with XRE-family HTH domain
MTSEVIGDITRAAYDGSMTMTAPPVGDLLRQWRERRRMTQLALALEADVSARHVSFLETGRSRPSREMIERLSDQLAIPLRERNVLHIAAGFAAVHPERTLDNDSLKLAREAIDLVLTGLEPHPALAVDRHWNLVTANRATAPFFEGVDPVLALPPVNVLRATFHPDGLAPRIVNLDQRRRHMLDRVRRQIDATADLQLVALHDELASYPVTGSGDSADESPDHPGFVVPFRLRTDAGVLSFLYTTTLFGAPLDVTVNEIAIEAFFPADQPTADALSAIVAVTRR